MNLIQKIEHWGDMHHAKWLDIARVILGLVVLGKGILFISDTQAQIDWVTRNNTFGFSGMLVLALIHVIAFTHLAGGILITLGLVTRFAVVTQIPILIGAVFFVNLTQGFSLLNSELWISIVVLLLMIVFWVIGSGPYSVDSWMKNRKSQKVDKPKEYSARKPISRKTSPKTKNK
jgi:uncharacterized membrane protein YphA (DoxX/SURF4 family)